METITVAAERIPTSHSPGMAVLIGIALLVVAIGWMALSRRHREPRG
ncbi:MAG: hypothetical protein JO158_07540 [Gammaproteobacteria bacterium]|nr:hypothetical protein [Gammaproteobacteria bacterium]MBV8974264.1 hypothetical protein [Nevskiaceae bacterium]MBV9318217.1 hypothetical protein [Gammaproteobacteria bacterium]MBV9724728.1 hypothetical protein [Gammaproteobacteria bacterium]